MLVLPLLFPDIFAGGETMANVLDCDIVASEFDIKSSY